MKSKDDPHIWEEREYPTWYHLTIAYSPNLAFCEDCLDRGLNGMVNNGSSENLIPNEGYKYLRHEREIQLLVKTGTIDVNFLIYRYLVHESAIAGKEGFYEAKMHETHPHCSWCWRFTLREVVSLIVDTPKSYIASSLLDSIIHHAPITEDAVSYLRRQSRYPIIRSEPS